MSDDIRILVLEDDEEMRESLASVLEYEGYHVVAVGQGLDAIEAARESAFDLVIADIRMKGISGLDALEQVRGRQPEIRSLVVMGYSTEADSIRAIRLGVGEYLKKPFDLDTFMGAVRRLIAQRREQQRAREREQALLRTTLLALEALARSLDGSGEDAGLVGAGRLAARLAVEVGLDPEVADHVRLATLVSGLEQRFPEAQPALLIEALSPAVRRIVRDVAEMREGASDEQFSLEASAAMLAREVQDGASGRGVAGGASVSVSRFPAPLLAALERVSSDGPRPRPREVEAGRRRRGLLSLAQALEGAGEQAQARHAYRDVLEDGEGSREGVEALLGLSRLSHATGDVDGARRMALHARDLGAQFGPVASAEASLEAGLLLAQASNPEAQSCLAAAARALDELRLPAGAARARLGLLSLCAAEASPSDPDLTTLLQPEHTDDLARSLWLIPWLLGRPQRSAPEDRALRRLLRDFPTELDRLLQSDALSSEARREAARLRAPSAVPEPVLRIYSLGPFEALRGDARVPEKEWQGRNVRHLLAYIAQAGRPVPVDVLLEQFWPDHLETGRKNLNWAVSILRKCLGPSDHVVRSGQSLQLNPDLPHWHDLTELRRELDARDDPRAHARRALQLYRGPYLEDCYLDWALDVRNQTELRVLAAARELARASHEAGDHLEVLETTRRVLELDSLDQDAWLLLMQANLALGRAEEAIRQFEACRKTLKVELGMEPSIEIMREHQRALLSR